MKKARNTTQVEATLDLLRMLQDPDAPQDDTFKALFIEHLRNDSEGRLWLAEANLLPDEQLDTTKSSDTDDSSAGVTVPPAHGDDQHGQRQLSRVPKF